jgi:hypothetical protein
MPTEKIIDSNKKLEYNSQIKKIRFSYLTSLKQTVAKATGLLQCC